MITERLDKVMEIVKEAGKIALGYFGNVKATLKHDKSLVTRADLETGQFLSRRLKEEFPGYGMINEETCTSLSEIPDKDKYTWIVDPIDGTASYNKRMPVWTVAVGLMKGLEPVMAVLYIPVLKEFYVTDENAGCYFISEQWGCREMDLSHCEEPLQKESLLCTVSYFHRRLDMVFPGKIRSMGSTIAHICYVCRGDAVAAIVKGAIWDIAPAWAILKKLGGSARYLNGNSLDLSVMLDGKISPEFIVMSCPRYIDGLIENITKKAYPPTTWVS